VRKELEAAIDKVPVWIVGRDTPPAEALKVIQDIHKRSLRLLMDIDMRDEMRAEREQKRVKRSEETDEAKQKKEEEKLMRAYFKKLPASERQELILKHSIDAARIAYESRKGKDSED